MSLYIIRGLPGVGKSTLAERLAMPWNIVEADQFWTKDDPTGEYKFDGSRAFMAHQWCEREVRGRLILLSDMLAPARTSSTADIVVANTFVLRSMYQPYVDMARELGANAVVITVDNRWTDNELAVRTKHGVPVGTIEMMRRKWEA
jgi:tRNA uridine 5-carbamoylmethylation protein Kti12